MNVLRIPHQFVLALTFSVIAIGFSAAIIGSTLASLRSSTETIRYAGAELTGIRCIAQTTAVLRDLLAYRTGIEAPSGGPHPSSAAAANRISTAIGQICRGTAPSGAIDNAVAEKIAALRLAWMQSTTGPASAAGVSAVIALIPPLMAEISGSSGVANDPSIDGINFGDALVRFPVSIADGSAAATVAIANLAAGKTDLEPRFTATRLLAQARTAIEVGRQDAEDEISVDAILAEPLVREADANVADFTSLESAITTAYVQAQLASRNPARDARLAGGLARFTSSSFTVIDDFIRDLFNSTDARIQAAQRDHDRMLWSTIAGLGLEVSLMATLAWISILSYRNGRRRRIAERAALESQRSELESQLRQAKAHEELLRAKAQFRAVFDRAPVGMIIVDRDCAVLDLNEAANEIFRPGNGPITVREVVADHAEIVEQLFAGRYPSYSEERNYDSAGTVRWLHVSMSPVYGDGGEPLLVIVMVRDVSENKFMEEQLVFDAGHDALTGLPNRNCFVTILQQALDDRRTHAGVFSVVFIDFNDFKTINDSLGHAAGDTFLIESSARLRDSVRASDIVARIGGDEFAILLYGSDRADIEKSVTRLQSVVNVPVAIDGQTVASSASFGVAQAEANYRLAAEIIRDADTAMYHAKAQGGRNYMVFDASMRERVVRRMQLSSDIVHALDNNELVLLYQPVIDLRDGTIAGCEALVRWRRADSDFVMPTEFIPLAEENGSIFEIGQWVTTTACDQLRTWNANAAERRLPGMRDDFVMHINLSVPEMHQLDLLSHLAKTIAEAGVDARQVILEITEGIVLKQTPHVRAMLDALTDAGFRLCIDDFGTGYSSLRYLHELPLYGFKIDRSFVSDPSGTGLANTSIVEMLLVLSRSLGLEVVAEGIETPAQWQQLRDLGCRYGQGYLFAPALDAAAFTAMLEAEGARTLPALTGR